MNKFIRLLFLFFISYSFFNFAGAQTWEWASQFGNEGNEIISGLDLHENGDYFIAGGYSEYMQIADTTLESKGFTDVFLSKLDEGGNAQWAVSGGSANIDETAGISIDASGDVVWAGQFWVKGCFGPDTIFAQSSSKAIFLTKYTATGDYIWSKSISGSNIKVINAIDTDAENNIYLTGYFEDSLLLQDTFLIAPVDQNFFILKYDAEGNLVWGKNYGTFGTIRGNCLKVDYDGAIVVGGFFQGAVDFDGYMLQSNNIDFDLFVVKFDSFGNVLWAKEGLGIYDNICSSIAIDNQNNVYLSGNFIGEMSLGNDIKILTPGFKQNLFLLKYDSNGTPLFARALDIEEFNDLSQSLDVEVCNDFVGMIGYFEGELKIDDLSISAQSDQFNGFVAAFDKEDGKAKWLRLIGGSDYVIGSKLVIDDAQKITIGGYFSGEVFFNNNTLISNGFNDVFVSKMEEISTATFEVLEDEFGLIIFPNPSDEWINISIISDVFYVKIYDIHGRLLRVVENEKKINISNLTSGNYLLKIGNSSFEKSVLFFKP